jgi:competence protein ComEA
MFRRNRERSRRWAGWFGITTAVCVTVWTALVAGAQEPAPGAAAPAPAGQQMVLATGPGADAFQRVCVLCHTPDRIVSVRKTKVEWEEIIDKMITRGAQVTDDNYGPIEEYLLRNYGKVNVNKAVKDDLVMVGGFSAAEADAVIKFRTDNGPIADFAALGKVPGLDAKKLEDKRDAFSF